jgi:hypothetical protein
MGPMFNSARRGRKRPVFTGYQVNGEAFARGVDFYSSFLHTFLSRS